MNARMYAVTPAVEAAWRTLLEQVTREAGVPLDYLPYPAPQPLETLWNRGDLGCVFMCGFSIALGVAAVTPIVAPIPRLEGTPSYRSDLIVRTDAPFRTLEDTFGGRAGWTVRHSHSGFNAFRHHLVRYRTRDRPRLYREVLGDLVTARAILDAVREGRIDVGPLDAYWHRLIARHAPETVHGVRVIASTDLAPIPPFVASAGTPAESVESLRAAFLAAPRRDWFAPLADQLLIEGFAAVTADHFQVLLDRDREARAADYPLPA